MRPARPLGLTSSVGRRADGSFATALGVWLITSSCRVTQRRRDVDILFPTNGGAKLSPRPSVGPAAHRLRKPVEARPSVQGARDDGAQAAGRHARGGGAQAGGRATERLSGSAGMTHMRGIAMKAWLVRPVLVPAALLVLIVGYAILRAL